MGTSWPPGGQPRKIGHRALGQSKSMGDGIRVYCLSFIGLRKLSKIASERVKELKCLLFQILFHFNYFTRLMNNFSLSHLRFIAG